MAVALSMAFFAGGLTFTPTASAYIINVGMEDLAAQNQAAGAEKKQESKVEKAKEHKEAQQETKPAKKSNVKPPQQKKTDADAYTERPNKQEANDDAKKALDELTKVSKPPMQKKAEEPKPAVKEEQTEESHQGSNTSKKTKKKAQKDRFQEILRDESFVYYMDTRSARYIPMPNRQDSMIDVWVKLKPNGDSAEADDQKGKYYLEHYYIYPKNKQIQFLCELEVTGRPSNAIKERPYSSQNWENLVPGSVEDDIYHAVVKRVKNSSSIGGVPIPSASDVLDALNIGL